MFGHSFVACLNNYLGTHNIDINLGHTFHLQLVGFGGMTFKPGPRCVERYLPIIQRASPQILMLALGTNDLADPACDPSELIQQVVSLARKLIDDLAVKICDLPDLFSGSRPNFNLLPPPIMTFSGQGLPIILTSSVISTGTCHRSGTNSSYQMGFILTLTFLSTSRACSSYDESQAIFKCSRALEDAVALANLGCM